MYVFTGLMKINKIMEKMKLPEIFRACCLHVEAR